MNNRHKLLFVLTVLAVVFMTACRPGTPKGVITPGKMEDILYDYHIAIAMATQPQMGTQEDRDFNEVMYLHAALKKHGVTEAEFDSSLVYYYGHVDRFAEIYGDVVKRLSEEAVSIGASVGEIGQITTFSTTGDTANVWNDATSLLLLPRAGYNRVSFELKADTTYKKGDSFQFNIVSSWMYKSGMKDALVYMAVRYDNDSISTHSVHCTVSGNLNLRVPRVDEHSVKEIRTFIYLAPSGEDDSSNLLFIDQIQLIRFHHHGEEQQNNATPPATQAEPAISVPVKPESPTQPASPDIVKPQPLKLR